MYVVVAGGGHMGTHLVSRLIEEGHDTVVIDVEPRVTQRLFQEKGVVALTGSASDMTVLEQAGLKRADVAVAMTGRDAENLAFCLIARYLGVPRVLARMINPQFAVPYRLVGATRVHSEAELLVGSFLTSIEYPEVGALMSVGKGDLVAFELHVPLGSPVSGRKVAEIVRLPGFPRRCVFIGVESASGDVEVPQGDTVIQGGTGVILAAHRPDLPALLQALAPVARTPATPEEAEAVEALRLVPALSGLAPDDLLTLASGARFESRARGHVVFNLGDPGESLYVVKRGAVALETRGGQKSAVRPPAWFGEMSALTGQPHAHTARVAEDARLLVLDGRALRSALLRNPFLALEFAKALSGEE